MEQIHVHDQNDTESRSKGGFCKSNSIFYSKRNHVPLPANNSIDVTTFISSLPHHGNVAFIDAITDCHLTFNDLWKAVDSVSLSLSDLGIRKGHVIFLLSPNSIFFPIVCLSVMYLGAIITTAHPLNTPQEIDKQIAISKPFLVFTVPELLPKFASSSSSNSVLQVVLISNNNNYSNPPCVKIVGLLQEMMKNDTEYSRSVREKVTLDDVATLLFSSGTTGESKGVVSTHRNVISMIQLVIDRFRTHEKNQVYLAAVPMFHTYGLATFVLGLLSKGCPVVVLPKFDMENMLTAIQKYNVTFLPLAPPIIVSLVNNADVINKRYDLKSLRCVLSGGAPLSKEFTVEFEKKFLNVSIFQGYALTESNGAGAAMECREECKRFGSVGLLTANTEAKIVDPDSGEALPANRTGELWLRGPSIMKGYFNNKEATASTLLSDRWLRTGDLCYIDDDGYIFVVDRLKELIKYNGYQVPPAELEILLHSNPQISDAAVIPFPDKRVGQYPMAYVVRKSGSTISDKDVMEFIAKQVAPYKKIRRVAFINSIPRNPTGKILRKNLIKLATSKI